MGEQQPTAAAGAVIVHDGRILLVQRQAEPAAGLWAVPGGLLEWGETWREAARREVEEETGLIVEIGDVAWVGESVGTSHHFAIVDFHAEVIGGELAAGSDARAVRWVPLAEASELTMPATMYELLATMTGEPGDSHG